MYRAARAVPSPILPTKKFVSIFPKNLEQISFPYPAQMLQNPQINTAPLSRRALAYSKKTDRKSRSLFLAQNLLALKKQFPEFDLTLERVLRTVRIEGSRSRRSDRQLILTALETGCAEIGEIAEETELPEPDVLKILTLYLRARLVEIVPRGAANELVRGAKRDYYFLTEKACDKYGLKNPLKD